MSSKTEAAMLALLAALKASGALPEARRSPVFDGVFEGLDACTPQFSAVLALLDGDIVQDVPVGYGPDGPSHHEIVRKAEIEFYVAGPEGDALNAAFDAGLQAIYDAIAASYTLGGVVDSADAEPPELGVERAGSRAARTALIRVALTYVSTRSY
ncbi:hypothetical protein [Methylocystis rosea]|uniref:hypothetical protein n=1 Tax=Methylocystis rosea TaxID=173366 RepID=UPI00037A2DF1|nr:hypothetical protein [Methylocystis rosea]